MTEPLDPWLGLVPSDKLTKLYARISDLLDQIDRAEGKPLRQGWRYHLAFDSTPRVAFPVAWKEIDSKKIDRCASMLSGPLFTSIEYPWPKLSEWRNGAKVPAEGFCEPILQIDMNLISRVARRNFEPGVVQVWMDDQDSVVRFCPLVLSRVKLSPPFPLRSPTFFPMVCPARETRIVIGLMSILSRHGSLGHFASITWASRSMSTPRLLSIFSKNSDGIIRIYPMLSWIGSIQLHQIFTVRCAKRMLFYWTTQLRPLHIGPEMAKAERSLGVFDRYKKTPMPSLITQRSR